MLNTSFPKRDVHIASVMASVRARGWWWFTRAAAIQFPTPKNAVVAAGLEVPGEKHANVVVSPTPLIDFFHNAPSGLYDVVFVVRDELGHKHKSEPAPPFDRDKVIGFITHPAHRRNV